MDTGGDSDTDVAAGAASSGGSLFDDYPSLVPPGDDTAGTTVAGTDSGTAATLFENYSDVGVEGTSQGNGSQELDTASATLETPPPPPELEGEELDLRPPVNAAADADDASEPTKNGTACGESDSLAEDVENGSAIAATLSDSSNNSRRDEKGEVDESELPNAAAVTGTERQSEEEGEGGEGEVAELAGPWNAAEKEDEG